MNIAQARSRYNELARKVRDDIEESGIKLALNCPADRAILSECGLTAEEVFEFLALFDARVEESWFGRDDEDTVRVTVTAP